MDPRRPDPDALLAQVVAAEEAARRGRLKVFLGAAPGVGKTYAMLNAARDLRAQGVDVVVGIVETHRRAETEALLEGLEVLPRQKLEYKGRSLDELDLDALLRRRPRVALIDELAHRNAPGARHLRRYQDIEELLDAGIDVYTTVNVQHLESLNDVVAQFTGVRVRETVPDTFFDRLRDIVLIDLPPRELIERLHQGKVYVPEQARAALDRFFSPSNLAALRELAMQTAADRVDAEVREHQTAQGGMAGAPIRRRVLAALDGHAHADYLVRVARRFAEQRHAPWTIAYVDTGSRRTDRESLGAAFQLAKRLGGETVILRGTSVADEILNYASHHAVSSILIGKTRERPLARALGRTVTQQLLARGGRFDLTLVDTPFSRAESRRRQRIEEPWSARAREVAFAGVATGAAIAVSSALDRLLPAPGLASVFLTAVVAIAVRARRSVALLGAVFCFLAYNFFFTEPRWSFSIGHQTDVVAVFAFLAAALVCSDLAARLRSQMLALRAANAHAGAIQGLAERLAAAVDEGEVLRCGAEQLASALGCEAVVLRLTEANTLRLAGRQPLAAELEVRDEAVADWSVRHGQPAGRYTGTLSASAWWFLPLLLERGPVGAVGLRFAADQLTLSEEQRLLAEAMTQLVALAADRAHLAADLEKAHLEGETERLRTALLASVSHDLRSPLSSVIGAATSLSAYGDAMSEPDRQELLASIRGEGERLDRYIQNLLDMTRLGSGGLKLERDWVSVEDVVGSAVARLRRLFPAVDVVVEIAPDVPLLFVHPALIEQAMFNILENAGKFSPPGEPVTMRVASASGSLVVEIADRGPGIPEAERHRIFDLFWSAARGDRGQRGSGLGLTIVRGMVGAHGGRVEALPGPGGVGTTIRVTLPLTEPPHSRAAEEDG
ncbi:MAG: sensor histidine kinase KdpD [Holophagales bacterium]|nr:MAG: sensor histidine kinase KdpD [Holophagales bacterium]